MSNFVGYLVSIDCRDSLGTFQGQISHVDPSNQALTLLKVYKNGVPYPTEKIIINACDIANISILEEASTAVAQPSVSVKKPVAKRAGRSFSESVSLRKPPPLEEKTPNGKKDRLRQKWTDRDEACFGTPIDDMIAQDFDFEKNLALFNKQAVYQEINALQRPDVVRHTDPQYPPSVNVLPSLPPSPPRAVASPLDYVTDTGLAVASCSAATLRRLQHAADVAGLARSRRVELLARGVSELALSLVGGSHRLHPRNAHQRPTVVALCGPHGPGIAAICAARHLAAHGVDTTVFLLDPVSPPADLAIEVALYRQTGNRVVSSVQVTDLPAVVDLVLLACGAEGAGPMAAGYGAVAAWTNERRAPVLAVDPPALGHPLVHVRCSVVPELPMAYSPLNGKIYLCNLALPAKVFKEAGINYVSPFGSKNVIALHPNKA